MPKKLREKTTFSHSDLPFMLMQIGQPRNYTPHQKIIARQEAEKCVLHSIGSEARSLYDFILEKSPDRKAYALQIAFRADRLFKEGEIDPNAYKGTYKQLVEEIESRFPKPGKWFSLHSEKQIARREARKQRETEREYLETLIDMAHEDAQRGR